ncbi:glutamate-cysteine ligase modifier subunit [Sodiomyces alkalinus F11]|uniref:GCS light chain n=1 Tax=Sodiomyces alkalinus (strain CBS 110278 / VKM F-3762 / F11) TaxID=1314773 RepID=A0A3N2PMM6_SODAK|nr:glutamate-cysteine ligase modifier subunit [Sodiomyces alkalinus F11]ROT35664.1 glutamate-cysteine ligase modifier subunit [Sodiomyces alkalinus F11]
MTKLILSTGNIVSGGPSLLRKPGSFRSNLELTKSLRNNFLAARQDYSAAASPVRNGEPDGDVATSDANGGHQLNGQALPRIDDKNNLGSPRPHLDIWTDRSDDGQTLYVPRIDWSLAGLQEDTADYDITVKLFFLPSAPVAERPRYIEEALSLVRKELGVQHIDLLIASFPDMSFEGDCEWQADQRNASQGDLEAEVATWAALEALHERGEVAALGISEFGTEKLSNFLRRVKIRPVVDQINTRDCCNVPPPLIDLARAEGINLLVHTDCTDILPQGTLRELLGQGPQGAGVLADPTVENSNGEDNGALKGDLAPQWVVKYTAFIRDRGVLENKGYFAGAVLTQG